MPKAALGSGKASLYLVDYALDFVLRVSQRLADVRQRRSLLQLAVFGNSLVCGDAPADYCFSIVCRRGLVSFPYATIKQVHRGALTSANIVHVDRKIIPSGRLVLAGTGPVTRYIDDVRRFQTAARNGIKLNMVNYGFGQRVFPYPYPYPM
ncbi:hypothetical protein OSTOST_16309 [Ostertagia ostertagi]